MPNSKEIRILVGQLNDDRFQTREQESEKLKALGAAALKELERTLAANPTAEVRNRCQSLIASAKSSLVTHPQLIQEMRAVHVLERIATGDAKKLLEQLSKGDVRVFLTREAKDALTRLQAGLA
jgi:hypothetical protein